jgi:hypothetical protein
LPDLPLDRVAGVQGGAQALEETSGLLRHRIRIKGAGGGRKGGG